MTKGTLFLLTIFTLLNLDFIYGLSLQSLPTRLRFYQVSQSYPTSFWRTLTSSVPQREFALYNFTLEAESEFVQILGASSSGKSTILRLLLDESPIDGQVSWSPPEIRPVRLEQAKSPHAYERFQTVQNILMKLGGDSCINNEFWESVVRHVCQQVGLDSELQSTPVQLSPSNLHRLGLAYATLSSILPALLKRQGNTIPSPLLLLDEWLDLETSIVANRVEKSILNLTRHGAVILCVTHKPHLFSNKTAKRTITMCRGEILYERIQ
jgi:ABC-type ATPase involved in cell division